MIRVVHTIASTRASHGGTSRSVPGLCESLASIGLDVVLVTRARVGEVERGTALLPSSAVETEIVSEEDGLAARVAAGRRFRRAVRSRLGGADEAIVHDHGAWLATNRAAARAAGEAGAALMISPRGMLTRWSLSHNRARKRLAWRLFQRRVLRSARLIHATSEGEAEELGDLSLDRPVAVIPNAIETPALESGPDAGTDGERIVLFLSRFHPKKGLPNLVEAWARVRPRGWRLVLVGPDEGGHRGDVERLARERGVAEEMEFRDAVEDGRKWEVLRSADLFVLPSHSENFGIVVGEALASGVPVVTTRATPWRDLETRDCGWWIDVGVEPLATALREATGASPERRAEMGRRGRELVRERYGPETVARRMREAYEWLLTGGSPPEFVRVP